MQWLNEMIKDKEKWLVDRIFKYAKDQSFEDYTGTSEKARRATVLWLLKGISDVIDNNKENDYLRESNDFTSEPEISYGIMVAQKYREMNISIHVFLTMLKIHRRCFIELINEFPPQKKMKYKYKHFIDNFFDQIEIAFCVQWNHIVETTLEEQREWFQVTLASIGDAVIATDLMGQVVSMNSAAEKLTGYTEKESLGQSIKGILNIYNEKTFQSEEISIDKVISDGVIVNQDNYFLLVAKDGTQYYISNSAAPIKNNNGEIIGVVIVLRDISERKKAEEVVKQQLTAMKASLDGIAVLSPEGNFIYLNEAHAKLYQYESPDELIGKNWGILYDEEELAIFQNEIMPELRQKGRWRGESKGYKKDSTKFPQELSLSITEDKGIVCVIRDISDRKQAENEIRHQAYHDPLTNLPNRMLFGDRLNMAIAHAKRSNQMLAVLFLDLDNFKDINDMLGHATGDQFLLGVADRLSTCLRKEDTISRLGGDEFTILMPEIDDVEDAFLVAQKVIDILSMSWMANGQEFYITSSIGIALYPNDGKDSETLMRHADAAMYRAKEKGNNYQMYTPAMNVGALEKLALENDLKKALIRNEFELYYQPQINSDTNQIIGMEALVRWNHPKKGLVSPAEFIPLSEETGLIVPLGEWVLRTACAQNKAWQEQGYPPIPVSVNLSALQFQQKDLAHNIDSILKENGLEPKWLQLEITESIAMKDADFSIITLKILSQMGIHIAIDDFGTGYSSLNYLKRFPIHTLKIDRSFVKDISKSPGDAAIVTTLVFLAQNLNLKVIAEGVETEEQLKFLKEQQCKDIQGFYFSKPLSASDFEKLLKKNSNF